MLRVWCGAALVLTTLFATATMALSREWEVRGMDEGWQVVYARMTGMNYYPAYVMNIDGTDNQPLALQGGQVQYPDCSPDGNYLAFSAGRSIFVSMSNGHALHQIHSDALITRGNVTVPNSGGEVIFRGISNYVLGTFWATSDASAEIGQRLPKSGDGDHFVYDLSPDGRLIAYQDPSLTLHIVRLEGVVLKQLSGAFSPAWSPDGLLAFSALWDGTSNIYIMDVNNSIMVELTHQIGQFDNIYPSWSPDGNQIFYTHHDYQILGAGELYVMNADGSNQRRLTDPSTLISWACVLTARPDF